MRSVAVSYDAATITTTQPWDSLEFPALGDVMAEPRSMKAASVSLGLPLFGPLQRREKWAWWALLIGLYLVGLILASRALTLPSRLWGLNRNGRFGE